MAEKPIDWEWDFPVLVPPPLLEEARKAHPDWWIEPSAGIPEDSEPFNPTRN